VLRFLLFLFLPLLSLSAIESRLAEMDPPPPLLLEKEPYRFSIEATYSYLELGQQGLFPVFIENPLPGESGTSLQLISPAPSWRSGASIAFNFTIPANWTFDFAYFALPNTGNPLLEVTDTPFLNFSWQWNNFFNYGQVTISRKGCRFFSPYIGLFYLYETQWYNTLAQTDVFGSRVYNETRQNLRGFGPFLNTELSLPITNYFSFLFTTGIAILATRTDTTAKRTNTRVFDTGVVIVQKGRSSISFEDLALMETFLVGVRVHASHFFLQVDWRGAVFPEHLLSLSYVFPQSNLGMQGFGFSLGGNF